MIGWKVMRATPDGTTLVSGADARLSFPAVPGRCLRLPHPGLWLGLNRDYVLTYYACHKTNALLALDFEPKHITRGNPHDQETEMAVSLAFVRSATLFSNETPSHFTSCE